MEGTVLTCQGQSTSIETVSCTTEACPGSWSPWNIISTTACSKTCGPGTKTVAMARTCNGGQPGQPGCEGDARRTEAQYCNEGQCPGMWTAWAVSSSSSCSSSCGPGTKTVYLTRKCNTPGLAGCVGSDRTSETRSCNDGDCVGRWGLWHDVSSSPCSVTCGDGQKTVYMSRTCIGGIAGELGCEGSTSKSETRTCNKGDCSGMWDVWVDDSSTQCSVTCGSGKQTVYMSRKCIGGTPGKLGCTGPQFSQQIRDCILPACAGKWSEWKDSSSTSCSATCGPGSKTVTLIRSCIGGNVGGPGCSDAASKTEMRFCNDGVCPGRWTEWSDYSSTSCSVTCGPGNKKVTMTRSCMGGNIGGPGCEGDSMKTEMRFCNENVCSGKWSEWSDYSSTSCSVTCGPGSKKVTMTRSCIGGNIGAPGCEGDSKKTEMRFCNENVCSGKWSEWSDYSSTSCSVTCGPGNKNVTITRSCIGGNIGGPGCEGDSMKTEMRFCNDGICPGRWTDWRDYSSTSCSVTCGPGIRNVTITRSCIGGNIGGPGCEGYSVKTEMKYCNENVCPGKWSEWSDYSSTSCTVTCGPGYKTITMTRSCIGGKVGESGCEGASSKTERRFCNDGVCPGLWSEWTIYVTLPCSQTCGPGKQNITWIRNCIGSTVGQPGCVGDTVKSELKYCNERACGPKWTEWTLSSSTSCSVSCGTGRRTRYYSRQCIGGIVGQAGCEGDARKSIVETCKDDECVGYWAEWTVSSRTKCSVTCGKGRRVVYMSRTCIGGVAGQKGCEGSSNRSDDVDCTQIRCPGKWSDWTTDFTTACSVSCGVGTRTVQRSRTCIGGIVGTSGCEGASQMTEKQSCSKGICPGKWSEWQLLSSEECSVTCDKGQKTVYLTRTCIGAEPGQAGCEGQSQKSEIQDCNKGSCLGQWGPWNKGGSSKCSVPCGPGEKNVDMTRVCLIAKDGITGCEGDAHKTVTVSCNEGPCSGTWSDWGILSATPCSETCGPGTKTVYFSRTCNGNSGDQSTCKGESKKSEAQICDDGPCYGVWTTWETYSSSSCSVSCGPGTKTVYLLRRCTRTRNNQIMCEGPSQKTEVRPCNKGGCSGTWSKWAIDSSTPCSRTCGSGVRTIQMSRTCVGGTPGEGSCQGDASVTETRTCLIEPCGGKPYLL